MDDVATISTIGADDAATVRRQHVAWVFGWDKDPGAPRWDFRAVQGEHYDWTVEDAYLYDDMDLQHRVFRSARDYAAAWEPVFDGLRAATHRIEDGPYVVGTPQLASTRLVFVARLLAADGSTVDLRSHSSLTWSRRPAGWRIAGDHTSSVHLAADEAARLLVSLPGAEAFGLAGPGREL